jgi:phosphoserine phosphatase
VPSYLAREDPAQLVLTPKELIKNLNPALQAIAKPKELDEDLRTTIATHLDKGDMVICMTGGGGNSLDEWLRVNFGNN